MHFTTLSTPRALSIAILLTTASASCERSFLEETTSTFIDAQRTGQIQRMEALDYNTTYSENFNKSAPLLFGIISQPQDIAHNRSTYDTEACASWTELIVTTPEHPYVIGAQLRFRGDRIDAIDTLVTDADDWLFNATGTLYWASREDWTAIPEEKRDSRAIIKAAADAYLDVFTDKNVTVPWGTPCARLEGGLYTGTGAANDSCNVGVPSNVSLVNRRYVVDEVFGTVDVYLNFGGDDGPPDSHEFRIQEGKIRYVHTMTVTANRTLPEFPGFKSRSALRF